MTLVAAERVAPASGKRAVSDDRCPSQRAVLVVDDHELVQAGLRAVLADQPWVALCLGASSAEIAWQVARRHRPQVVLMSTSLGSCSGLELCRAFTGRMPHVRVVLMSGEGQVSAPLALSHGAAAALSKHLPTAAIVASVKRVADGARVFPKNSVTEPVPLSKRELEILRHLASGLNNPQVAALLNLSRHTVKQHTSAVYRKLGVRNRAEAASRAQELGLIT